MNVIVDEKKIMPKLWVEHKQKYLDCSLCLPSLDYRSNILNQRMIKWKSKSQFIWLNIFIWWKRPTLKC